MNFDLNDTRLEKGASLIEASAGTGKTYTIAGIFLRLLLEQKFSVHEILVVTYTNAATEELRSRIRALLRDAARAFSRGQSDNPFLQAIYTRHRGDRVEILQILERALCGFDEAPIYSIHGFCQRMLKDRAFESGALFDMELAADVSGLLQEIADDYWRRNFYYGNPIGASFILKNGFSPGRFLPWLTSCLNYPLLRFLSRIEDQSLISLTAELEATFEKIKACWNGNKSEIKLLFGSHQKKAWANSPYNDDEKVAEFFLRVEKCFACTYTVADLKCVEWFCTAKLIAGTGKNKTPPQHEFFKLCDELCRCESNFLTAIQMDFLRFAKEELPRRKDRLKVQSFDDLLTRLHHALQSASGDGLVKAVGRRYKAALIDEFQDTDPIQYEIFRSIFFNQDHYLFLIGDPKQAIYGFRGADIFTYLKAASVVARKFTLGENWRSESGLVDAINSIFCHAEAPFVVPEIKFEPVRARGEANRTPLLVKGQPQAPFELWFWPRGNDGRPISKEAAEEQLPHIVAAEIARLLSSDARIGDRRVRPQDIAVLVVENRQAQLMQEALSALSIPSVQQTTASLFESQEASDLHCILLAMAEPSNERLLKAALATETLGMNAESIYGLAEADPSRRRHLESFHDYFRTWTRGSFIQMFREFLRKQKIRSRLLSLPDGERRLTNFLHLGEVLHKASIDQRLGVRGLIKWLANQRSETGLRDEEYQLRLERDENALKLVTIHRSKGLEYGIVFCPFSWKHSELMRGGEEQVFFHDRKTGDLVRDLGSDQFDNNRELATEEKVAENLRLLYVALTRAKHRCYFVWGQFNKAGTSAPAWLFHNRALKTIEAKAIAYRELTDEALLADLHRLQRAVEQEPRPIVIRDIPRKDGAQYSPELHNRRTLVCPTLKAKVSNDWRVTSFSALTMRAFDETPDHDEPEHALIEPQSPIFTFPKGTRPGTCLHEIFENWNFSETDPQLLRDLVSRKLKEHGLSETEFVDPVSEMVRNVLTASLDGKDPEFRLEKIARADRLSEMEFYFPLKKISAPRLQTLFSKYSLPEVPTSVGKLTFDPVTGYMKGFIDLVFQFGGKFYIVDWKSNWLGNSVEQYGPAPLRAAMAANHYDLQARIYSLALHQYLRHRLPDYSAEHFGGVFYIFLRGVDPGKPGCGIYHDEISYPLLTEMADQLIRS
jgi:exodeoxyribonuclease V beta subunit